MDTLRAFSMGYASRGGPLMVFDWHEAARRIAAAQAVAASAGLSGDWECTGGDILKDSKPVPRTQTYVYLASTWATPELDIGNGPEPCFIMKSDSPFGEWDAETYWPQSALDILTREVIE